MIARVWHGRIRAKDADEYVTISLWDSYDNIKAFAGEDISKARYYPKDKDYLLEFEETVRHFDAVGEVDYAAF